MNAMNSNDGFKVVEKTGWYACQDDEYFFKIDKAVILGKNVYVHVVKTVEIREEKIAGVGLYEVEDSSSDAIKPGTWYFDSENNDGEVNILSTLKEARAADAKLRETKQAELKALDRQFREEEKEIVAKLKSNWGGHKRLERITQGFDGDLFLIGRWEKHEMEICKIAVDIIEAGGVVVNKDPRTIVPLQAIVQVQRDIDRDEVILTAVGGVDYRVRRNKTGANELFGGIMKAISLKR